MTWSIPEGIVLCRQSFLASFFFLVCFDFPVYVIRMQWLGAFFFIPLKIFNKYFRLKWIDIPNKYLNWNLEKIQSSKNWSTLFRIMEEMRKNGFFCGCDSRSKHQLTYAERQIRPLFCNEHENRNKLMRKMRKKTQRKFVREQSVNMEKRKKMATTNN